MATSGDFEMAVDSGIGCVEPLGTEYELRTVRRPMWVEVDTGVAVGDLRA